MSTSSAALADLVAEVWEWKLRTCPEYATFAGDRRYDHLLSDMSPESIAAQKAYVLALPARIEAIDRSALPHAEQLTYDVFLHEAQASAESERFPNELLILNHMNSVHAALAELAQFAPRTDAADIGRFTERVRASGVYLDQAIALLREGLTRGVTPPRITLAQVGPRILDQVAATPEECALYRIMYGEMPETIPTTEQARLRTEGAAAIAEVYFPAVRRLDAFFHAEYEPGAREATAWTALPDGEDWYAHEVRRNTTTERSPSEIHALGVAEVARIEAEMETVARSAGYADPTAYLRFLWEDASSFFADEASMLAAYRGTAAQIETRLPELFGILPEQPYDIVPVPAFAAPSAPAAYYMPGSPEAGRRGTFYINTHALDERPCWGVETLTAHEAVPGHHLQTARAAELAGLPPFRRYGMHTAYVEGWGLYAEKLGEEIGLYADPSQHMGRLVDEMMRAVRLVVDTGMHAHGWTRERALTEFATRTGKGGIDAAVEIDRYLVMPAQALAYKVGERTLVELRTRAEDALGAAFDVRRFHDLVLEEGSLPLTVLERRVDAWIAGGGK